MKTIDLFPHEARAGATELWRPVELDMTPGPGIAQIRESLKEPKLADELFEAHVRLALPPHCPYGLPGDVVGLREEWRALYLGHGVHKDFTGQYAIQFRTGPTNWANSRKRKQLICTVYEAAGDPCRDDYDDDALQPWRPANTLPRWAIRRRLTVESVEVRRVDSITEAEAMAAGFAGLRHHPEVGGWLDTPQNYFRRWWEQAHPNAAWAWHISLTSSRAGA